jgi:hypothetical protein
MGGGAVARWELALSELTDIESVRQYLQKSTADRAQDEDIAILIRQASAVIERFTRREYAPSAGVTRTFAYRPTGCYDVLDFSPYEARSIETLKVGETTISMSAFELYPATSLSGTYFGVRLGELPAAVESAPLPFYTRTVTVKGDWGMLAIPEDVQHWANATVAAWLRLRLEGRTSGGFNEPGEGFMPVTYQIPPDAWRGLQPWVRPESLV